jgi:hypothetical protein
MKAQQHIQALDHVEHQLEELLYLVGDSPTPATEDQIMNYIIGMLEGVRIKREQLTIPGPTMDQCGLTPASQRRRDVTQPPWSIASNEQS